MYDYTVYLPHNINKIKGGMNIIWRFIDSNRLVKVMKTKRTIKNKDETVVRFSNINKLPGTLQKHILQSDNALIDTSKLIYGNKYITITTINGDQSIFDIQLIAELFKELGVKGKVTGYIKSNYEPLVVKYKSYYYVIFPVKFVDMTINDMVETGIINAVC